MPLCLQIVLVVVREFFKFLAGLFDFGRYFRFQMRLNSTFIEGMTTVHKFLSFKCKQVNNYPNRGQKLGNNQRNHIKAQKS